MCMARSPTKGNFRLMCIWIMFELPSFVSILAIIVELKVGRFHRVAKGKRKWRRVKEGI